MISLISPIFFEELLTEGRYMGDTEKTMWMHGDGFQSIEKIE